MEALTEILAAAAAQLKTRAEANRLANEGRAAAGESPRDEGPIAVLDFGPDLGTAERDALVQLLGPKTKRATTHALVSMVRLLAPSYEPPEATGPEYFLATPAELETLARGNRRARRVCEQWRLSVYRHEKIGLVDLCGWTEDETELGVGVLVLPDGSPHLVYRNRDGGLRLATSDGAAAGGAVTTALGAFAALR